MRKRTINHVADTIFWYLIYFMPAICYILLFWNKGETTITLETMFTQFGFGITENNIIANALYEVFGSSGILPLFSDNGIILLLSWFASVMILHVMIDCLLFIIRLAHKWIKQATQGD